MRVGHARAAVAERLGTAGVLEAGIEAEVLVRHALQSDRAGYFASIGEALGPDRQGTLNETVRRRASGEPLAYILGRREFYGLDFVVNRDVLVPRQETELLVDAVLDYACSKAVRRLSIADIGTGSGAIAITLASRLPDSTVYATDSSLGALAVARINTELHDVSTRVRLEQGDLLAALPSPVDVIVSNPPYLRTRQIPTLAPELGWEPVRALDGGADGLAVTRPLLKQAPGRLLPDGALFVEIDPPTVDLVMEMARSAFPLSSVSFQSDLMGLPRVVSIRHRAGLPQISPEQATVATT